MTDETLYNQDIESRLEHIQDEILADREASMVVMEVALTLSHRYDKDQGTVASDIEAAFTYKFGESPSDWADTARDRAMDM